MKKLLLKITFPILACLLIVSCAGDKFSGVEESPSFDKLATYFDEIDEWNPKALVAMEGVSFNLDAIESSSENECGNTTTTTSSSLHAGAGDAMHIFSNTLGFESNMSLNRWFIEFGKIYYDLVIEQRPDITLIQMNVYLEVCSACR